MVDESGLDMIAFTSSTHDFPAQDSGEQNSSSLIAEGETVAMQPPRRPKRLFRRTPANFASRYFSGQITGHLMSDLRHIPKKLCTRIDKTNYGLSRLVLKLDHALASRDLAAYKLNLASIGAKILQMPGDERLEEKESFVLFGGAHVLARMFLMQAEAKRSGNRKASIFSTLSGQEEVKLLAESLNLFREVLCSFPHVTQLFCEDDDLITHIISLTSESMLFECAASIAEELLALRQTTFELSSVPKFQQLVQKFASRQFAFFCRLLALVVFEPEDRHLMETSKVLKSVELLRLRRDRMIRKNNTIDRNHAIVLGIPDMLPRLVKLMQVHNYISSIEQFPSQLPDLDLMFMFGMNDENDWDSLPIGPPSNTTWDRSGGMNSGSSLWRALTNSQGPGDDHHNNAASTASFLAELVLSPLSPWAGRGTAAVPEPVLDPFAISAPSALSQPNLDVPNVIMDSFPEQSSAVRLTATRSREGTTNNTALQRPASGTRDRFAQALDFRRQMKAMLLAPHQVEVLFIVCTLLGGKRKADVQDRLYDLHIVNLLSSTFDNLNWGKPPQPNSSHLERIHGPTCECTSESAIRIQYLRLVHNFCDRDCDGNRETLGVLSRAELALVQSDDLNYTVDIHANSRGLMSKIIAVLIKEPHDSTYRFWLSSCVEAFLRGADKKEQIFIAKTGVLEHLVEEVLSDGFRCAGALQTAFDLLGELIKCNPVVLAKFTGLVGEARIEKLMRVLVSHLVDSNVFIRATILSIEQMRRGMEDLYISSDPRLLSHVESFQYGEFHRAFGRNRLRLLRDLMNVVSVEDVNHENICCLNTAVVMFVFSHRENKLATFLKAIKDAEEQLGRSGDICANFRALLWFWCEYYSHRGRDRLSLECSSGIRFSEWFHVVQLLCRDDGSETALTQCPPKLPRSPFEYRNKKRQALLASLGALSL